MCTIVQYCGSPQSLHNCAQLSGIVHNNQHWAPILHNCAQLCTVVHNKFYIRWKFAQLCTIVHCDGLCDCALKLNNCAQLTRLCTIVHNCGTIVHNCALLCNFNCAHLPRFWVKSYKLTLMHTKFSTFDWWHSTVLGRTIITFMVVIMIVIIVMITYDMLCIGSYTIVAVISSFKVEYVE